MLGGSVAIAVLGGRCSSRRPGEPGPRAVGIRPHEWISDPTRALDTHPAAHLDVRLTHGDLPGRAEADPGHVLRSGLGRRREPWTRFRKITLPLLSPIIFFNLVLQIIGASRRSPRRSSSRRHRRSVGLHAVLHAVPVPAGFGQFQMGYAAAMAWVLLLIIAGFTAVNFSSRSLGLLR